MMVARIRPYRLVMGDDGICRLRPDRNPATGPTAPVDGAMVAPQLDPVRQTVLTLFPDMPPTVFPAEALKERNDWALRWILGVAVHRAVVSDLLLDEDWRSDFWSVVEQHVMPVIAGSFDRESIPHPRDLLYEAGEWVDQFGPSNETNMRLVAWMRSAEFQIARQDAAFSSPPPSPRYRSLDTVLQRDRERLLARTGEIFALLDAYEGAAWDMAAMWRGESTRQDLRNAERKADRRQAFGNAFSSTVRGIGNVGSFMLDMHAAKNDARRQATHDRYLEAQTRNLNRKNNPWSLF